MTRHLFTSESVTEGHPDKIADQIGDAILAQDPRGRVAVETLITTGQVHAAGELSTAADVDIPAIVRKTILAIGFDSSSTRMAAPRGTAAARFPAGIRPK